MKTKKTNVVWTRHYNYDGQRVEAHWTGDKGDYSIRKVITRDDYYGDFTSYEVSNSPKRTSWYVCSSFQAAKVWAGHYLNKSR